MGGSAPTTQNTSQDTSLEHLEPAYQMYRANLGDQGNDKNYDLRGWWYNNVYQPSLHGVYPENHPQGAHFVDKWKKTNHPTISDESMYAQKGQAGHWVDEHHYQPAPNADINKLQNYLQSPEGEGMRVEISK